MHPGQTSSVDPPSPVRLLVVDDDPDVSTLLSRYFSTQGFVVSVAANGGMLRQAIAAGPVDLVLLDLGPPGEDGFALTRYLHGHWRGPMIIVSGRGESVDCVVGLELSADDYITKPFDLRELLARVRSVLGAARRGRLPAPTARLRNAVGLSSPATGSIHSCACWLAPMTGKSR